jgi:uncharacterized membrane protein
MDADAIRRELRHGVSDSLRRRRWISVLSVVGVIDFAIISLYQMGIIRHLPDPPGAFFDSDEVNASRTAYALGVPDGPLGLGLYAITLILAGAGGDNRRRRHPVFDVLVGGAVAAGVVGAAHYVYDMIRHQQRACPYCLVGAVAHVAMLPSAVANATVAIREMRGRAPAA